MVSDEPTVELARTTTWPCVNISIGKKHKSVMSYLDACVVRGRSIYTDTDLYTYIYNIKKWFL
jgi:hypothetical protein